MRARPFCIWTKRQVKSFFIVERIAGVITGSKKGTRLIGGSE